MFTRSNTQIYKYLTVLTLKYVNTLVFVRLNTQIPNM